MEKDDIEWKKRYLTQKNTQQYYDKINGVVNQREFFDQLKTNIYKNIQRRTKTALDSIESDQKEIMVFDEFIKNEREKENQFRSQLQLIKGDFKQQVELDIKIHSINRKIGELKKEKQIRIDTYSHHKDLIHNYWNLTQNDFYVDRIEEQSKSDSIELIDTFVKKNTEKMATILDQRPDCTEFEPNVKFNDSKTLKGVIEGNINVKCNNNDSFTIKSQLEFVREIDRTGEMIPEIQGHKFVKQRKSFLRFPTSFHNINHKRNFYKKQSEQWMNTEFAKKE